MNCFIINTCWFYLFMQYLCLISPTRAHSHITPEYTVSICFLFLVIILADVKLFQTRLFAIVKYFICYDLICVLVFNLNNIFFDFTVFLLIMKYFHSPNSALLGCFSLAWTQQVFFYFFIRNWFQLLYNVVFLNASGSIIEMVFLIILLVKFQFTFVRLINLLNIP